MAEECADNRENLGLSRCKNLPSQFKGMFTVPKNLRFTATQAATASFWQDLIKSGRATRVYLWPEFDMMENLSEETTYEDTSLSYLKVRDGQYRFKFSIHQSMCLHKAMFTHASSNGRVVLFDQQNQLLVTQTGTDEYAGLNLQLLNPEKLMINDGSVTTKSPIMVALRDNLEIDENGYTIKVNFLGSLERLTDVDVAVIGTPTATSIVVSVKASCDGTHISGLVVADFVKLTAAGATQSITSATEDADAETYSLVGTGWTTGSINLVAAEDLSIDAYESTGAATVTIA